ncbi:MAG: hypothetical protein AVO34_06350 [Firmicutes bacterium ML8_F2]|jgi:two-component system, NarL family, invasion response regulator UvrY|nr:MAG: hypothetical protein AVO34_06350 [Firmicutes bacterium ML8_F2]
MVNVLIVDDHPVIRLGIRSIIEDSSDIGQCFEAGDVDEMFKVLEKHLIDLIILDISMPGTNGIVAIPKILLRYPNMKLLIMSALAEDMYAMQVVKAGAHGFISKESVTEELPNAISTVIKGSKYLSNAVVDNMMNIYLGNKAETRHELLSPREIEVLILIGEGHKMADIAKKLHISIKTVSAHRSNIMQKMNMNNNSQLIKYCIERKLVY